jgi:hypothetical protein
MYGFTSTGHGKNWSACVTETTTFFQSFSSALASLDFNNKKMLTKKGAKK